MSMYRQYRELSWFLHADKDKIASQISTECSLRFRLGVVFYRPNFVAIMACTLGARQLTTTHLHHTSLVCQQNYHIYLHSRDRSPSLLTSLQGRTVRFPEVIIHDAPVSYGARAHAQPRLTFENGRFQRLSQIVPRCPDFDYIELDLCVDWFLRKNHDDPDMRSKPVCKFALGPPSKYDRQSHTRRMKLHTLKTDIRRDANFVVTGDTGGCRYDNHAFCQRRQKASWKPSIFSVRVLFVFNTQQKST